MDNPNSKLDQQSETQRFAFIDPQEQGTDWLRELSDAELQEAYLLTIAELQNIDIAVEQFENPTFDEIADEVLGETYLAEFSRA
jgi:hypothetical protein